MIVRALLIAISFAVVAKGEPMTTTAPATQPVRLVREADKVWLEGVRGFSFGQFVSSTYATQAEIYRVLGDDMRYDQLVGGSGLAFRTQIFAPEFCPSAPHAMVGFACGSDKFQPRAFKVWFLVDEKRDTPRYAQRVAELRAAVRKSIDAGVPVILLAEEDGLIIGYQKDGAEWVCLHPMSEGGARPFVEKTVRWGVAVPEERRTGLPTRHETALAGIQRGVASWTGDGGNYYVGQKAWEAWIERVEGIDAGTYKPDDCQLANAWMYDSLVAHRRTAARYLKDVAADFPPAAADHLSKAAALYATMTNATLCSPEHCVTTIAPYPAKDKPWTAEHRKDQLARMRAAMKLDQQAIDELKAATAVK